MAPHSSTLAWKIPWTEEPGRLQSMGSQRVRHAWEYTHTPTQITSYLSIHFLFFIFFVFRSFIFFSFYFILLYNTVLVLPYINMYLPRLYTCSQSWTPFPPPSPYILLGHPSAPAPSILYPASNLDWPFISYMILYIFQCHFPKSSYPFPLPQSPKDCSHILKLHLSFLWLCPTNCKFWKLRFQAHLF